MKNYEIDLINKFLKLLEKVSPYIITQPRWRMFDVAMYVAEPHSVDGFEVENKLDVRKCPDRNRRGQCRPIVEARICYKLPDGKILEYNTVDEFEKIEPRPDYSKKEERDAWYKKHEAWLASLEKLYKVNKDLGGISSKYLSESEFHQKKKCKSCKDFEKAFAGWNEHSRVWKRGLHLFEFKSDHDNVERFAEQLPHYILFADYVWLVIGEKQDIPIWLPPFVGIWRRLDTEKKFVRVQESKVVPRFPDINRSVLKKTKADKVKNVHPQTVFEFLKKWFINSVFSYKFHGNILDMQYDLSALGFTAPEISNATLEDFGVKND